MLHDIPAPTALPIDRDGRNPGRLVGPAEGEAPEVVAFLESIVAKKQGFFATPQLMKEQGS